ncbi:MAG: sensor histidine kinase [Roseinatronobacter sp.]|nr:sensor histidine kinase [Roseinatronobacter sp.]
MDRNLVRLMLVHSLAPDRFAPKTVNQGWKHQMRPSFWPKIGYIIRTLVVCLVLLVPATSGQAKSELIASVGLMADKTALLDVESAARGQYEPSGQTMTRGYSSAAQWARLHILPAPDGGPVVLFVRPPLLDDVTVYAPVTSAPGNPGSAADTVQYQLIQPDWPSSLRGYSLSPPDGGAVYLVRIVSSGSLSINVTAQTTSAANRISVLTDLVHIGYFAIMLTLFLWALRMLMTTREPLFGWFAAMQSVWLLHNFLYFGYLSVLLPKIEHDNLALAFRAAVFIAAMLSIAFHRAVMIRFQPSAFALHLFDVQLGVMFFAFILFWTVDRNLALHINAYCIVAAPFIFMLNVATARKQASPGLITLRITYTLLSVFLLLWVSSLLGYGQKSFASLYGFMIHGLTTGLLMSIILHIHGRNLIAAARDAEAEIAAMEQQRTIEQERTRTLAQFIDMLTHEARNALSVINMSIATPTISKRQRKRLDDAILGLTGVIDRCNQTIRIDTKEQTIEREDCDLVALLRTLCSKAAEPSRISFHGQGTCIVKSDPVLLGVVFGNIIDNAFKYSPPSSEITIKLEKTDKNSVLVMFENLQGTAGMPEPGHVFEKYYRSQRAKGQIGSGLGLYIVRGLVHMLGGKVTYEPIAEYVRFRVCLPC